MTSLTFATVPDPVATRFEVCWPGAAADAVIAAWQHWAPDAPDEITANLTVAAEPGRPLGVTVSGACLDDAGATASLLDELVAASGTRAEIRLDPGLVIRDLKRSFADGAPSPGAQWADRSWAIAHPHGSGRVYPNFPDPYLDDWAAAYHGSNLPRLAAAKQSYDPGRIFHFPQAI